MSLKFTNAADAARTHGVKSMVYGQSGVGKTVLMATMPRPLLISIEAGLLSLSKPNLERLHGVDNPAITYNMPVIEITSVDDLADVHNWLQTSKEAAAFDSIGFDSLSEAVELVLSHLKRQIKDGRQLWPEVVDKAHAMIRAFRDIKHKNVCVVAKLDQVKDDLTGITYQGPSFPGNKLGPKTPYFFDEVFCLRIGKDEKGSEYRYLQTQPDLQVSAKDRSGALEKIEYPNLFNIFNKINGV